MDEPRPFYRDSKIQAILVVLFAVLLYFFTLGRQGAARDVLLAGAYGYISVSNDGGVRVLSLQNPSLPVEVGYFDTPGSARRMALSGSLLYVADGERGLRILNVLNPNSPVETGAIEMPGETLDVAISGRYAYLAMGDNGIIVVDISNPAEPSFVNSIDTPGKAQAITAVEVIIPGSLGNLTVQTQATFLYVADGDAGLGVYNFLDPLQPVPMSNLDTPGNASDVALVGPFAVLADGRKGIQVIDVSNPVLPVLVSTYDQGNFATSLDIVGSRVYFTEGDHGFTVIDITNPRAPFLVVHVDTPGDAQAIRAIEPLVYVADGSLGMRVINLNAPGGVRQVGLYETPGEANLGQLVSSILSIGRGQFATVQPKVWRTWLMVGFDLVLFFGILFIWLAFFAQFVLPVRGFTERRKGISRLLLYLTGGHGPAVTIQDGKIKQRQGEARRRGPGVAWFDTASAGVFRNPHMFTKVAGPGVVFTDAPEYLAGVVDLHIQAASIGPRDSEDPYAPPAEEETEPETAERQERRFATSGLTRDGVEVVPNISVVFRLDSDPGQGRTQFGFDPESVRRAIAGEGINPDAAGSAEKHVPWGWLPVRIAADLWREYLRKFPLDELFTLASTSDTTPSSAARRTAFDCINEMIKSRMTSPEVDELDEYGEETGKKAESMEFAILEGRGIKVISAGVRNLRFPKVVEKRLIEQWQATWLQRARGEAREIDRLQSEVKTIGQEQAVKEFAIAASQQLGRHLQEQPPLPGAQLGWRDTLENLIDGTLRLSIHEVDLQTRLTNQRNMLVEIIEWVRRQAV